MSGVEETAPEVGFVVTATLWLLVAIAFLIALKAVWTYTIGALMNGFANLLDFSRWGVHVRLGGPIRSLNNRVERYIGDAIIQQETLLGKWFHSLHLAFDFTGRSLEDFATGTLHAFHALTHATIPGLIAEKTKPIEYVQGQEKRANRERAQAEAKTRAAGIEAGARDLQREKVAREHGIDRVNAKVDGNVIPRIHTLEGEVAGVEHQVGRVIPHRLSRLERLLGAGVIGGAAIAALTRVFPYWQCSNVKRFMRNVCRSPLGSLDWLFGLVGLLALSLEPWPVVPLVQEAEHLLSGAVDEVVGAMRHHADPADVAAADARSNPLG